MLKQNIWKPSTYRDHQDVKGVFLAVILALCHFMAGGGIKLDVRKIFVSVYEFTMSFH
jgi:hypothetical protein